jgi:hypothetical protein
MLPPPAQSPTVAWVDWGLITDLSNQISSVLLPNHEVIEMDFSQHNIINWIREASFEIGYDMRYDDSMISSLI